jgi:hypothetical protein
VAIIAGTVHPNPSIKGIKDLPCKPTFSIHLSTTKAARAKYPESSSTAIAKYRRNIVGIKTRIAPTPSITPEIIEAKSGLGIIDGISADRKENTFSKTNTKGSESMKVNVKMTHKLARKMGIPRYLSVRTSSNIEVM